MVAKYNNPKTHKVMKVIILNYLDLSIQVAMIPYDAVASFDYAGQTERLERYLVEEYGYSLDSINYMTADDDYPIEVYPCGVDTLKTKPIAIL